MCQYSFSKYVICRCLKIFIFINSAQDCKLLQSDVGSEEMHSHYMKYPIVKINIIPLFVELIVMHKVT
jgi:hypothetical protein